MTHELKILPRWFEDVCAQRKTFEIRKNDRNYNVGDTLILKEWYRGKYTGREVKRTVSYIYHGDGCYGLSDEYVVMAIRGARVVLDDSLCKMDGDPADIDKAAEQPEKRTEERTESHARDCISRKAEIDEILREVETLRRDVQELKELLGYIRKYGTVADETPRHIRKRFCEIVDGWEEQEVEQ